ncbi:alpha/beta hydrolase [Nocardia sp. NPDC101769]|uniref:alpha/beta hydrolase n=1 Tax=Nocardia sp. NPDC101769 TaxID=3364333 RepID=UPI0037F1ECC8
MPVPRRPLSFPTILAASTDDPFATARRVTGLAEAWGSRPSTSARSGTSTPRPNTRHGREQNSCPPNRPRPQHIPLSQYTDETRKNR